MRLPIPIFATHHPDVSVPQLCVDSAERAPNGGMRAGSELTSDACFTLADCRGRLLDREEPSIMVDWHPAQILRPVEWYVNGGENQPPLGVIRRLEYWMPGK